MISAVIPARDCSAWIEEALQSLVTQSTPPQEIILLDDGSVDDTAARAEAMGIPGLRILRNDRPSGISAALTRMIQEATGRFIVRMDADDIAQPDRIATQLQYLERQNLAVIGSWAQRFGNADTLHRFAEQDSELKAGLVFASPFCHPSVILDRDRLGPHADLRYDSAFDGAEDHELWIRLRHNGRFGNVPKVLLRWRLHGNNAGSHPEKLARQVALGASLRSRLLKEMGVFLSEEQAKALDLRCAAKVIQGTDHRHFLNSLLAISRGSSTALGTLPEHLLALLGTHWDLSCHFAALAQPGIPALWIHGRRELGLSSPVGTLARLVVKSLLHHRMFRSAPSIQRQS